MFPLFLYIGFFMKDHEITYNERFLVYSLKNIARGALFMFIVFLISTGISEGFQSLFTWERILFAFIASLGFGFLQITLQRYLHKRGEMKIPQPPKYSNKSYKEIQEEKASKSKDV